MMWSIHIIFYIFRLPLCMVIILSKSLEIIAEAKFSKSQYKKEAKFSKLLVSKQFSHLNEV